MNSLSETNFASDNIEIEAVECLWACSRGCVVAVSSDEKPSYLFTDILPEEKTNTALLEFIKIYIKSRKGNIAFKKIPQVLQDAIAAVIPIIK